MITDGEKSHYLAVKSLSAFFRGITSNHKDGFYFLSCFCSYSTENKLKKHKKVCENHDYCNAEFDTDDNNKKYHKVKDHCPYTGKYKGAAHNTCILRHKTPKEIPVVFHNGSKYDYHFIIKQIAEEFEGQFECLGENTEKYITFSVPMEKGLDNGQSITYKIMFIDSFRFMSSSLSRLVDNLSEVLHRSIDANLS